MNSISNAIYGVIFDIYYFVNIIYIYSCICIVVYHHEDSILMYKYIYEANIMTNKNDFKFIINNFNINIIYSIFNFDIF